MKLNQYIEQTATRFSEADLFFGHGTDNALDEAVYLIYSMLNIDFKQQVQDLNNALTADELELLEQKIEDRIVHHKPVAYLVGDAWFAGYRFFSDERALIPRSPIAELIRNHFQSLLDHEPSTILDLCSGGGCIGIACALHFPQSTVDLADISKDCLALAQENVDLHAVNERVSLIRSDVFSQLESKYDLIVSNPPYVSPQEFSKLPAEYLHEPASGLISDDQGLELPLRILRQARDFLSKEGLLVMEVGHSAELLAQRLPKVPLRWLEFETGGEGVFALTAGQLQQFSDSFN